MRTRLFLLVLLLVWAHAAFAEQVAPLWTNTLNSDKTNCVAFARQIAQIAKKQKRQVYYIVGYTKRNRPHASVVVDGWVIDNGANAERIFHEDDIWIHWKEWYIVDMLTRNATLRIKDNGEKELIEGSKDRTRATED